MKRFDARAKCPKCGHDAVSSNFHRGGDMTTCGYATHCYEQTEIETEEQDHILRDCRRCHYEWIELPLDATGAKP